MGYVHHCVFCGWQRAAESAAMLDPRCERCGSTLRADRAEELSPAREERAPAARRKPSLGMDAAGLFCLIAAGPFLLPFLGVQLADFTFALPFMVVLFAATRAAAMAERRGPDRHLWLTLATATALGAATSAFVVGAAALGAPATAPFYLGATASVGLLVAGVQLARRGLRDVHPAAVVDAILPSTLIAATAVYFVVVPGLHAGDPMLTFVVLLDLAAVLLAAVAATSSHRPRDRWLAGGFAGALLGDALVSGAAAGQVRSLPAVVALLWTLAGYAIARAVEAELRETVAPREPHRDSSDTSLVLRRVVLPLAAVLAFPLIGVVLWLTGQLDLWAAVYFSAAFILVLLLVFGRQASLLIDNQRAVLRERRLRFEADRRNEELEALTGLATTMTQTLEEPPITEQALTVLHLAARASSSALHAWQPDGRAVVSAASGDWLIEREWAGTPSMDEERRVVRMRGGRQVVRLRLMARGNDVGAVTLVRSAADPLTQRELELLGLLVDQLAMALQNARDYRDRLEQAVRDPLTGVYNRRFFSEALEKEVGRIERYGSEVSVVMLDIDDFKLINDTHGHAVGDEVLRRIGEIVQAIIRPVDSFARIGGEEFALLLPETRQLDGLLVAERVRTAIARHAILNDRRVTVSAGVASCPHDATTVRELLNRADSALYWAKRNGKDLSAVASEVTLADAAGDREGVLVHLYALVSTIDARHLHTRDHSENVAAYALALGQALGLPRERIVQLRRAALLHDIGKVAVSEAILNKPEALSDAEWEEIKLHPTVGASMLEHAGLGEEATWVRHHHEWIDGRGYPDGIAGEAIPFEARIIFVADAFEAMTSDRPYRSGMPVERALAELRRCSGTQFEPVVVDALEGLVARGELAVLALREDELNAGEASRAARG